MTIRHVVAWKLTAADDTERAADAARIARELNALQGVVPELISITAGAECVFPGENFDVAVVADVADAEALARYKSHPAHIAAGAFIGSVTAERVAVDFTL
ncbi:Dabb family protein [Microbacterium gorillae]|uniref:Dabb family protein n=1 Tax=Microbacterium gorillae TaxID=1231063 RepID=UPI00058CD931|nr:Dabb family protein [Microbacterium gorillae]